MQIFAVLVDTAGKLVAKDELMARAWPGVIVEENTLIYSSDCRLTA